MTAEKTMLVADIERDIGDLSPELKAELAGLSDAGLVQLRMAIKGAMTASYRLGKKHEAKSWMR